ncbi:hypothetical protein DFH27DRAFT_252087 [Peziza echinospora]|nr:hypothetical protein DFH27DRAFT_252087 [Peziza echinospora]
MFQFYRGVILVSHLRLFLFFSLYPHHVTVRHFGSSHNLQSFRYHWIFEFNIFLCFLSTGVFLFQSVFLGLSYRGSSFVHVTHDSLAFTHLPSFHRLLNTVSSFLLEFT